MSYVVAGAVFLLSFIVGTGSYLFIPRLKAKAIEVNDGASAAEAAVPATTLAGFFTRDNVKQWVPVVCLSVLCAVLAFLSYNACSDTLKLIRQMAVLLMLAAALIIDSKTHLIPNALVLGVLGVGVLLLPFEFIFARESFVSTLVMNLVGLLGCTALFYVLSRLTKGGIGMGDVKLIAVMGFMIGLMSTLTSILLSLIICTVISIFLLLMKRKNKNDKIPFGPFVFFGYAVALLLFGL